MSTYTTITITATLDGIDRPDYYTGHGHAFEEKLIACIFYGAPVYKGQTMKNLFEDIINAINGSEWDIVTPGYEDLIHAVPDSMIAEALRAEFDEDEALLKVLDLPTRADYEGLYAYGWLHVYGE